MISKATLKSYEFENLEHYFNYIIDSVLNGNFKQVKELFKELSTEQKKAFMEFMTTQETIIIKDTIIRLY